MKHLTEPLRTPIRFIKGVGPRRAEIFAQAGYLVLEDLLLRLPIRYEDRSRIRSIDGLQVGESVSVSGTIVSSLVRTTRRRGFQVFEILLKDDTDHIRAVFFNQTFLNEVLGIKQSVILFGKVQRRSSGGIQFTNPQYEIVSSKANDSVKRLHTSRIVPVYERIGSVTQKVIRRIIYAGVELLDDSIEDALPSSISEKCGFPSRRQALAEAHFPDSKESVEALNQFRSASQRRLIFEEFFLFQVGLALKRRANDLRRKSSRILVDDRIRLSALNVLPFRLTGGQRQALKEIVSDLQRPQPMNRLLQGDVGSGKTIVALLAALVTMENGLQVAFMSPTEILAEQHFKTLSQLLGNTRFSVDRLAGTMTSKAKKNVWDRLEAGEVSLLVGTHALVQESVRFNSLGLVVIDEQHRFGVVQRVALREKGVNPDVLVMTATPIPRTLAMTVYGDLEVSVIRDLPPGRHPVTTTIQIEEYREETYRLIESELDQGRQVYVVYPLVEESSKVDLKAATEMAAHLSSSVFRDRRVAVLHGRMKSSDRDAVMSAFLDHDIDILVSTTVIEVGVDVPNASVMVVENAERFGLAQLHQLRGRVGRGSHASYCVLMCRQRLSDLARDRLNVLSDTSDGFELSERDLELRGPGDFFGTRQSGVPLFRVGNILRDQALMEDARRAAFDWLESDDATPDLLKSVKDGWVDRFGLVGAG